MSKIKLLLSIIAVLLMMVPAVVSATETEVGFAGGDGSVENPYQIATKYHLDNVRNYPNANFVLIDDIVFEDDDFQEGGDFYNAGAGWKPFSSINATFDGNGHFIENLQMTSNKCCFIITIEQYGKVEQLELKNISYRNQVSDPGEMNTGRFAGIAINNKGIIDKCFASGFIDAYNFAEQKIGTSPEDGDFGGGVCNSNSGTISECVNSVGILSDGPAAGISCSNSGKIENCENFGIIYGLTYNAHAGICNNNGGTIQSCINLNGFGRAYGICTENRGTINACYYLKSSGYKGATEWKAILTDTIKVENEKVNDKDSYQKLEFDTIWAMNEAGTYPILRNNAGAVRNLNNLFDLSRNVENIQVKGTSYKSIGVSWDEVEGADSYIVIKGKLRKDIIDAYPVYRGSEVYERVYDNYYSTNNLLKNGENHYTFYIVPVFTKDDVEYYGFNAGFGSGVPVNTLSENDYEDTTSPSINNIEVMETEVYKPGVLKMKINASDGESGITSISVDVAYGGLGMEGSESLLTYTQKYNKVKNLKTTMCVPIGANNMYGEEIKEAVYSIGRICFADAAGNKTYINGTMFTGDQIEIKDEFDIEFEGVLSNKNVPNELKNMDEGKTVLLKKDTKSNGIIKKEVLDAIKGQDKTVVVYVDKVGSLQWVFYGKDITGETKDLDLNVTVAKEAGAGYGCGGSLVRLKYANNGKLPGTINFRLKSDYIKSISGLDDELYLYYLNGKSLKLENSSCQVIKDGSSHWCYIDLTHNSTFYLSGKKLAQKPMAKQTIKLSTSKYAYDGKAKKPKVTVEGLKQGDDYTVQYKNNIYPGTASVIVKGINDYAGQATKTFTIKAPTVAAQKTVTANLYGYDDMQIKWSAQTIAGAKTKYKVQYKQYGNNYKWTTISAGTTSKSLKKSNFKDGVKYSFKVTPYVKVNGKTYLGKAKSTAYIYTLKKINKPSVKKSSRYFINVSWKNINGETGYQIAKSTYKTKGFEVVKKASYKKSKVTIKAKRNKTYYYKVRAYKTVNGKPIYGPWSSATQYKLK